MGGAKTNFFFNHGLHGLTRIKNAGAFIRVIRFIRAIRG
jgi:hypothetical protein